MVMEDSLTTIKHYKVVPKTMAPMNQSACAPSQVQSTSKARIVSVLKPCHIDEPGQPNSLYIFFFFFFTLADHHQYAPTRLRYDRGSKSRSQINHHHPTNPYVSRADATPHDIPGIGTLCPRIETPDPRSADDPYGSAVPRHLTVDNREKRRDGGHVLRPTAMKVWGTI
jgi:hypothetical protein